MNSHGNPADHACRPVSTRRLRPTNKALAALALAAATCLSASATSATQPQAQPSPQSVSTEEEFPTPQEILAGGFPAEEPWLSEAIKMREALSLDPNDELVRRLLVSPTAQAQWRTYGVVLTEREEVAFATARLHESQWLEISRQLSELPGWAGSELVEAEAPGVLDAFEVWYGKAHASTFEPALRRAVRDTTPDFDVVGVQVDYSYDELEQIASAVRAALKLDDGAPIDAMNRELVERIDPIVDALAGVDVLWVGLDSNDNGLVAYSLTLDDTRNATTLAVSSAEDLPSVELRIPVEVEPDTGPPPCVDAGCPPAMGGNEIERRGGTARCTMGLPLSVSGDLRWSTAGHCHQTNWDAQRIRGSGTYPGFFNFERDLQLNPGTRSFNGFYSGSTIDITTLLEEDYRVTNRIRINSSAHTTLQGWIPQHQIPNNGTYRVCKSGAVTGYTCGFVTDRSQTITAGGGTVVLHEQIGTTYHRANGDSGGPVVSENNPAHAVGMHQGRHEDPNGVYRSWAGSVSNISNEVPGANLYLVPDPRRDWVLSLYEHAVERFADSTGYAAHRSTLNYCGITNARQVAWPFYTGAEFTQDTRHRLDSTTGRQVRVEKLYRGLLGRASDTNGFNAHYNNLTANRTEQNWQAIVNAFLNSAEFGQRVNGGGASAYLGQIC